MKTFCIAAGSDTLVGVSYLECYHSREPKECILSSRNTIQTPVGPLVPQYENDGVRRKFTRSLSFYESGALKSISLQEQTSVSTPVGEMPAELVTFYENGAVKRLFPQNGKLSGFWSEENEYAVAPLLSLQLPFGKVDTKLISLYFYENGEIKSIALWPKDHLDVPTPAGILKVRVGVSFHKNGAVRSVEPAKSTPVGTPIGVLKAFDLETVGICADQNSLCFSETGGVEALKTSENAVEVTVPGGSSLRYAPQLSCSHYDDSLLRIEPLQIRFAGGRVSLDGKWHTISASRFFVTDFVPTKKTGNGCPGCDAL